MPCITCGCMYACIRASSTMPAQWCGVVCLKLARQHISVDCFLACLQANHTEPLCSHCAAAVWPCAMPGHGTHALRIQTRIQPNTMEAVTAVAFGEAPSTCVCTPCPTPQLALFHALRHPTKTFTTPALYMARHCPCTPRVWLQRLACCMASDVPAALGCV